MTTILTLKDLLKTYGIDFSEARLVRHENKEILDVTSSDVLDTFLNDPEKLTEYISWQEPGKFGDAKYLVVFCPAHSTTSLFLAIWEIEGKTKNSDIKPSHLELLKKYSFPEKWSDNADRYNLKPTDIMQDLSQRLVIEWGKSAVSWAQPIDKNIVQIKPANPMEDVFKELKRRVSITANNRFNANKRLKKHNRYALFVVILFSLILILVSIANTLDINTHANSSWLDALLIFLSVVILTISTVLSMSNFSLRGERHHDCGRELNALSLNLEKILAHTESQTLEEYEKYQKLYEQILSKYENHEEIDHLYTQLSWSEQYKLKWHEVVSTRFKYHLEYFIEHLVYISIVIIGLVVICTLVI